VNRPFDKATIQFIGLLLIVSVLLSCSHTEKNIESDSRVALEKVRLPVVWNARGRIAVIDADENWYAHFVWQQNHDDYTLRFTGPMGQTQLLLEHIAPSRQNLGKNRLLMGKEEYENADSMSALLQTYSPIQIPLASLKYWSFGKANPELPQENKNDTLGQISQLVQQGWDISFSRYEAGAGGTYPAKITAQKEQYKIKLFIRSREIQE